MDFIIDNIDFSNLMENLKEQDIMVKKNVIKLLVDNNIISEKSDKYQVRYFFDMLLNEDEYMYDIIEYFCDIINDINIVYNFGADCCMDMEYKTLLYELCERNYEDKYYKIIENIIKKHDDIKFDNGDGTKLCIDIVCKNDSPKLYSLLKNKINKLCNKFQYLLNNKINK